MGQAVETGKEGRAAGPCSLLLSTGDIRVREHAVGSNPPQKRATPFFSEVAFPHDNHQGASEVTLHITLTSSAPSGLASTFSTPRTRLPTRFPSNNKPATADGVLKTGRRVLLKYTTTTWQEGGGG